MRPNNRMTRRQFVSTVATAAGGALLPSTLFASAPPTSLSETAKREEHLLSLEKSAWKLKPFPTSQVRLKNGPFKEAMEANRRYLLSLPPDRLLHTFRLNAGLPSSAKPLGGWEKPDCELRGHFTGGHYLSACALMCASAADDELKARANGMVMELARCQRAHGDGYLSAFPEEFFDRLRDGKEVWAPFYTLHKIMAGLVDMYVHCGNEQALEVAQGMTNWIGRWTQPLSDAQMQRVMQTEFGGTNEVLYNLYALTGNSHCLELGDRFYHKKVFDPLAAHRDELKSLHANTNIPKMIGAARRYELTEEARFREIASFFWQEVTGARAYCTGGTSNEEHWRTDPGQLAGELGKTTEECCCGYNMLKLTRHIFGWTADPRAMDYYERTLFNSRLGTQDADGLKSYYLPLGSDGYWKSFHSPRDSFWCCTGTGVEEFAKFGDTIYFHDEQGLFVNLFIASELSWPEKGVRWEQETDFPEQGKTRLIIRTEKPAKMDLNIRIPYWATRGGKITLNGETLPAFSSPSSYLTLSRTWNSGDSVGVSLPMGLHIDALPGDPTLQAVMYGPLVLAGRLGSEDLSKAETYLGYDPTPAGKPAPVPAINSSSKDPTGWVEPVPHQPLSFRVLAGDRRINLVPFYKVLGERYAVYWKVQG
ncbi:MAG TPA: beta-L-arabinofuranosidase domain-containing protein [Terriglobia bacterium]|nr:beta-L-arabinofuranosidase domain-containing protein [Terriglobia bacterium]